jgi:uncharacterized protein YehS (DUF1456 family)
MDNMDLLQALRTALGVDDEELTAVCTLGGAKAPPTHAGDYSDELLRHFLDGLILRERGPRTDGRAPVVAAGPLGNNEVLKKLRIALNLQEQDMQLVFEEGGAELSASEINAMFRKPGNKHFRPCSDEVLLHFLAGLNPSLDS